MRGIASFYDLLNQGRYVKCLLTKQLQLHEANTDSPFRQADSMRKAYSSTALRFQSRSFPAEQTTPTAARCRLF